MMIRAHDHDRRVPADDTADALFHGFIAGEVGFLLRRDGVDVARLHEARQADLELTGTLEQPAQQEVRALTAVHAHDVFERIDPFLGLGLVHVGKLALEAGQQVHEEPLGLAAVGAGGILLHGTHRPHSERRGAVG